MKRLVLVLFAVALLGSGPAAAQKVYVDYDRSADFNSYKTFAWAKTPGTSLETEAPLMHSRIKNSIESHLARGGLIEDSENPDLRVTYHTSSKEEVQLQTSHSGDMGGGFGYGYGDDWEYDGYWGGGMGMGSSTTNVHRYERGSIIIDIVDAKKKEAIFRGTAEAVVKGNLQKRAKQIERAVSKIVQRFDKMYAKGR